jgi:hypothetical protein
MSDDKRKREIVAIEQDGQLIGVSAARIFSELDCGKLGKPAKTVGFAAKGRNELA